MLHNSGPYGPNDVPINMGVPVNMTQMSSPMNLGNNLGNLAKMPQQAPQTSTQHYTMPDYSSFGHPPLNMGHSMSPFANYHHLNFQANYGHTNPHLTHKTTPNNAQNNMLPMNLNIQSDHGPSLMNYPSFESKRFDVNNAQYKESFSRKMPINIPQIHTKAFQKHLGMEANYDQYNSIQENPFYSQDLSKTPEKSLIDSNRRKSLENTVKLIENILINSTPKDKLRNLNSTESFFNNTHMNNTSVDLRNTKLQNSVIDNIKESQSTHLNLCQKMGELHNPGTNLNNLNLRTNTEIKNTKIDTNDFDVNMSERMSIPERIIDLKTERYQDTNMNIDSAKISVKQLNVQTNNSSIAVNVIKNTKELKLHSHDTDKESTMKIQSKIHCEPLRRSLMNNNRIMSDERILKTTNITIQKDIYDKQKQHDNRNQKMSDDDVDSEKEEPLLQVNIKEETIEDTVKVKVEPLGWSDGCNVFLKDSNATHRDITESDAVIVEENNVVEAQEAVKKGSNAKTYYECSHCNLLFKHPKRFLIHTKWHSFGLTNEKRQELAKEKETKKSMKREAKIIERLNSKEVKEGAEGDTHPCKDCDKVFSVKSSLKNHRQRYHPTRVRECKICNTSVVGWMALRAHMAAHTGGGGYQCPECPKRFKYAHSLAKHKDTHLEKTHGCEQCEKKFGSQALLKMHMKCHERTARGATFRCTYCGKGFFESYNLQVHERTHRNERPFTCEICKTSFGTNSSLKRHLKVSHSTAKPFPCPTCHRCFASATTRARHAARAHGDPTTFPHHCPECPRRYRALKELHKHKGKAHPELRE